ncbi:MAG TPA: hypothetical protein VFX15_13620 [Actinomycetes bacterium]|nr:hypothetical protein [Actinomycetes bacterium]
MAALVVIFGALVVAMVRAVREDRPVTPPGESWDWRDDAVSWNRLGIR